MEAFETLILLLAAAAGLSVLAQRINAPYPALLALAGATAALAPLPAPELTVPPDLALALFIAPVLLDAAFDTSVRELKENWVPITFLSLAAVGLTVIGVAWTAKTLVPELPWAAAIALGAIVAPPDAAAATAVLKIVRPPHRVLVVLQGESLFNDASSLLIYRLAVGAAGATALSVEGVVGSLALATLGSVALGWGFAIVFTRLLARVEDAPVAIVLQFCGTFGLWMLAEALHVSAIIAVVVNGIVTARHAYQRVGAVVRAPAYAVWESAVFALNALAFLLIGLQVGPIVDGLSPAERVDYAGVAFAVLLAALLIRPAWVMSYNTVVRVKNRWFGVSTPRPMSLPTWRTGVIVSWAGMRGIVSLAAAFALPADFPQRDLIMVCTFAVVLGTLILQGFTLGPLMRWLGVGDDGVLSAEIRNTRIAVARAALDVLAGDASPEAESVRAELQAKLDAARNAENGDGRVETAHHAVRRRVIVAQRDTIARLRREGAIGDDAYNQLEEELDRSELSITPVVR